MSVGPLPASPTPTPPVRPALGAPASAETGQPGGFSQVVNRLVGQANEAHASADQAIKGLVSGEGGSVHDVVLHMAKADLAFRLLLEIRNRLTESYQEIMRMQV